MDNPKNPGRDIYDGHSKHNGTHDGIFHPRWQRQRTHTHIRHEIEKPLDTPDDVEFTKEEILAVIEKFDPIKAPGMDGQNSKILLKTFKRFPTFITGIYNECLRKGHFQKQWKHSIILPIIKPETVGSTEVTKYRPISLLNVGGKVLEKLLIDRINHYAISNSLLNANQYEFVPQKNTIDAALAVKSFIGKSYYKRNVLLWWDWMSKEHLTPLGGHAYLAIYGSYDAQKSVQPDSKILQRQGSFSSSKHTYSNENCDERLSSRSCCGPGFWNIMYNALLNLNFSSHTKVIVFAYDLAVLTKGKTPSEAEAFANSDLAKTK
jgi:hypothetical protein